MRLRIGKKGLPETDIRSNEMKPAAVCFFLFASDLEL